MQLIVESARENSGVSLVDVPAAHGEELIAWLKNAGLIGRIKPTRVVLCLIITGERDRHRHPGRTRR